MDTIKISLDKVKFTAKPQGADVPKLCSRIANAPIELNDPSDLKSFVHAVGDEGQTFSPATFKSGKKTQNNFEQMQMFVLDFDGNISYDEVSNRAEKYELPILAAYDTFSSTNHNRFRVMFLNDTSINNIKASKVYKNALLNIFPESDKTDSDISKMYYGGKELIHFDESLPTINAESLFRNMYSYTVDHYGEKHYKERIRKFAKDNNIRLSANGLLDITFRKNAIEYSGASSVGGISPDTIIYNIHNGEFPLNSLLLHLQNKSTNTSVAKKDKKLHSDYRSDILSPIDHKCKLFHEFSTGSRKLDHDELFGIATNIVNVESGISKFLVIFSKYTDYYDNNKISKWKSDLRYMKQNDYKPQCCNSFCAYKDICNHSSNILNTARPQRGTMERVEGYDEKLYSIEEAQDDLAGYLESAVNSKEDKWFIIKAMTALGKTEAYLNLLHEHPEKNFLIVVPTNKLKREVAERAKQKEIELLVSPSMDEIDDIPADLKEIIDNLRNTGRSHMVYEYVQNYMKSNHIDSLAKYYDEMQSFDNEVCCAITTHRKFLNMNEMALEKYDEIIIDEDIILSSIAPDQYSITKSELKNLKRVLKDFIENDPKASKQYRRLLKKVKSLIGKMSDNNLFTEEKIKWDWKKTDLTPCDDNKYTDDNDSEGLYSITDIPALCQAERFMVVKTSDADEDDLKTEDSIVFLKPFSFVPRKYIMMSATADKTICEYCFGKDNVEFCECRQAQYTGRLIQYYEKSMSRSSIDSHIGVIDAIRNRTGIENVITFKKYGRGEMYFGNAIGCDSMKGQDILVIGTPYKVDFVYKLLPFTLGLAIDGEEQVKSHIVTHNGCRFTFTTYENEVLQQFHLWMIESELEQAVGRARLTRFDCTVKLFSNFPLKQAEMTKLDFDL